MAKLVLTFDERVLAEYPVDAESDTTIGRLPDNTVVIDNPAVSGHHARIFVDGADSTSSRTCAARTGHMSTRSTSHAERCATAMCCWSVSIGWYSK